MMVFSVDVEDWFQVENFKRVIREDDWENYELRVQENTMRILALLDMYNVKATFFILGWIAERVPEIVREIHARGHEIASHGYSHKLINTQTPSEYRVDVRKSKQILENIIGEKILGYRAPSFSITDWAIEILQDEGYKYDSSYYPSKFNRRYGKIKLAFTPRGQRLPNGMLEFPLSVLDIGKIKIPWSGGGYFRLYPYLVFKVGVKNIIKIFDYYVFYIHPWEIDPDQPKVHNIGFAKKFRHHVGINNCMKKLERLLKDFTFTNFKEVMKNHINRKE